MFITTPQYEQCMPDTPEQEPRWWRSVTLFAASYWFLFVYETGNDGEQGPETAMAFDEWTLFSLVSKTPVQARKAICRFEREGGRCGRWTPRWLEAMWVSGPSEVETTGVVLLQFEGEPGVRDIRMAPIENAPGRRLLFQTPRQEATGA